MFLIYILISNLIIYYCIMKLRILKLLYIFIIINYFYNLTNLFYILIIIMKNRIYFLN